MKSNEKHIQHLYWRAGFGPAINDALTYQNTSIEKIYNKLEAESIKKAAYLRTPAGETFELEMNLPADSVKQTPLTIEERTRAVAIQKDSITQLNFKWMDEMIHSKAQLREKIAFFWHDHFACKSGNAYYNQELLHVLRSNALGNFRDLVTGVCKSAAMIAFLNSNSNKKTSPNENLARELMELFTLGQGNYTEDDVKEAARAFTGWSSDTKGKFLFRASVHDTGEKNILGKKGNFTGEDVIRILLENKKTARHITYKIFQFFVSEEVDDKIVDQLADQFYTSNYDISKLMRSIFTSKWFYEDKYIGNRIKSPVEWWIGINRQLPLKLNQPKSAITMQQVLGQHLFNPPNVAGWPLGKAWIDNSSLLYRMQMPRLMHTGESYTVEPKADDDRQMGTEQPVAKGYSAKISWDKLWNRFAKVPRTELPEKLTSFYIQADSYPPQSVLMKHVNQQTRENFISSYALLLMQCPEYQYC